MREFTIFLRWDEESQVWWAQGDDLPGLVAEAPTREQMKSDLAAIIPELIRRNLPELAGRWQARLLWEEAIRPAYA